MYQLAKGKHRTFFAPHQWMSGKRNSITASLGGYAAEFWGAISFIWSLPSAGVLCGWLCK